MIRVPVAAEEDSNVATADNRTSHAQAVTRWRDIEAYLINKTRREKSVRLMLQRVDDLQKRETMEIRVTRTDLADSMLAHKNRGMGIVQQIAGEVRKLRDYLLGDGRMPLRRNQEAEAGEAITAAMKCQAPLALHGRRITLG
jgi:hypothetical protein